MWKQIGVGSIRLQQRLWKIKSPKAVATHSTRHPAQASRRPAITGPVPSHLEIQIQNPVRRAFPRSRPKLDTSPRLSRDAVATIPAVKRFPSGLIPPYSPRWFSVWELIQCSQAAAAGAAQSQEGDPGGAERGPAGAEDAELDQRTGIPLVWCQGGMCTSSPSMFAPGRAWESSA